LPSSVDARLILSSFKKRKNGGLKNEKACVDRKWNGGNSNNRGNFKAVT